MAILLDEAVASHPDAPAVVDGRGTTSWAVLDERVERLVHALRARGLGRGDHVVTVLGNQVELLEVSLACAHAGWVHVPVNWHWVADEVAYVLDDAEAAVVVVDDRWRPVVDEALARSARATRPSVLVVGGAPDQGGGTEGYEDVLAGSGPGPIEDAERGGPMFYTSGTTGRPKGVRSMLGRVGGPPDMFTLMAHSMRPLLDLPPEGGGVQLICGPLHHSAQWVFASFSLFCGATVVLQHRFDADELLDLVDRHGVTNLHLVPTQMSRLLALPEERRAAFDGSTVRAVLHGAAPCPPAVKRGLIEWWGPIVTEYYGGTEGGFLTTISAPEWLERPTSVGRAVPIVELVVLGPEREVLPPGETGDVFFRNLMGSDFEYHKAPEKTAAAHAGDGLGTLGDVGHLDEDGYLHLSDRRIDMIVSGGVNIYPTEIEGVLVEHPDVLDAAVFGIPHEEMGEQVHAALALAPGATWGPELEAEVLDRCVERLAGYKRPRSFEVHDELPRNAAGKLTKRVLRDPHWAGRDRAI